MSSRLPSVTVGADRHPGPYYVRVGSLGWLTWDKTVTDSPLRSEVAAFEDKTESLIAAISATLQTRQTVSVCVWARGTPTAGDLQGFMTVAWYTPGKSGA